MTRVPDDLTGTMSDIVASTSVKRSEGKPTVVCVSGPRGSGKNLTSRLLANAILLSEGSVAVLDGDCQSPMCGAPGMLTLTVFDKPIPAIGSDETLITTHSRATPKLTRQLFVGTDGKNNPGLYARSISSLYETWRGLIGDAEKVTGKKDKKRKKNPINPPTLVVNCVQWSKGIGSDLVLKTIMIVDVFRVLRLGPAEEFESQLNTQTQQSSVVTKSNLGAENGTLQWMLWGLEVVRAHTEGDEEKTVQDTSHLDANGVWEFLSERFAVLSPWRVDASDVLIVGEDIIYSVTDTNLNTLIGCVVGLSMVEGKSHNCYGAGLVRSISGTDVFILTNVSTEFLSKVNTLVHRNQTLPFQFNKKSANGVVSNPPFWSANSLTSEGTGAGVIRSRNNILRKGKRQG